MVSQAPFLRPGTRKSPMQHAVWQRIGLSVDPERWAPIFGHDAPKVPGGCKLATWLDFKTKRVTSPARLLPPAAGRELSC